ncbi:hypothetical protein ACIOEX_01225 [Streptomyces sp. NPDC087850]|uniref:hypothetical protein n=1 Tax=Streptomyces sp. NPDC087850 TaxID=3365809 RepID=UPI003809D9EB
MPLRIGRWQAELHQRAIHITREPDPHCPNCAGSRGSWMPHHLGADWDECACLDQLRTWRIPLWPHANHQYTKEPF